VHIDIKCERCGSKYCVDAETAGQNAKCDTCGGLIAIPESDAPNSPTLTTDRQSESDDKPEWYVQTEQSDPIGPITRSEVDSRVADGRIDDSHQILRDGWDQWKWAEEVFPQLAVATVTSGGAAGNGNPYQPPDVTGDGWQFAEESSEAENVEVDDVLLVGSFARTRSWVIFVCVCMFISAGLTFIGGVLIGIGAFNVERNGFVLLFLAITYIMAAIFHGALGACMYSYAERIGAFLKHRSIRRLRAAITAQESFWRVFGCFMILSLIGFAMLVMVALFAANIR